MGHDSGDHGCAELLRDLQHLLCGELTSERREQLRQHLDACPPCFETADFQAQVRQVIASKCAESVPDDFAARIRTLLT